MLLCLPRLALALCFLVAFAVSPRLARAQTSRQQWTLLTLTKRLPQRQLLYLEAQPRLRTDVEVDRLLLRTAYGYLVRPNVSVWLGYAWTPTIYPRYNNEHRVFQQLQVTNRLGLLDVTNRTRLEQRFIEGADDTSVRARHFVRGLYSFDGTRRFGAVVQNEYFYNLNSAGGGPQAGFDQNRVFGGLSYAPAPYLRVEAGLQTNVLATPNRPGNARVNLALLNVFFNL